MLSLATGTPDNPILHRLGGQTDQAFFEPLDSIARDAAHRSYLHPNIYTPFDIDLPSLRTALSDAPMEYTPAAADPMILTLPRPDGTTERFQVVEAPIMAPALAAQFPEIKTFRGQGIDNPAASVRFDYTPAGFHAQVLAPDNGTYYIDPYYHIDATGPYVAYFKHDLLPSGDFECLTQTVEDDPALPEGVETIGASPSLMQGTQLRTYRLACAADAEYTAFFGGTVALGQAAVVTAINRVNQIYEAELDIHLTLVANNSNLIYTNSSTDPYTNSNGSTMLTQNQNTCDSVIGSGNYDIGHVFSTGGGGVAGLGVVCVTGNKARGVTGNPSPVGDSFWVDYVVHEMGHEFGANHTFNSTTSNCGGGNRSSSHAYEPGSGSTIMAYAGICGADDLQPHSDPYFAADSLDAIFNFINTGAGSAVTGVATGNNAPTADAGPDHTIPYQTPFALTGSGSDPDGDPITYDWQERDLGAALTLAAADNGASPTYRVWNPTSGSTRSVPILSTILAGNLNTPTSPGSTNFVEKTYAVARTNSNWRLIVRDNKSGGGGIRTDDMVLHVINTGSGFSLTSPNSGVTWTGNATQTITWNVSGTTASGINTANVKISLSTDGGNTFPTVLLASTSNDGSESITVPNISTTQARIKVEAVGNIFFDIGNANFTINPIVQSSQPNAPDLAVPADTGVSTSDDLTKLNNSSPGAALQFTVSGTVSGATITILADGTPIGSAVAVGSSTTVTTDGSSTLSDGPHSITSTQSEPGKTLSNSSSPLTINIDTIAPALSNPDEFVYLTAPHQLVYKFTESVQASLSTANIDLEDATTSTPVATGDMSLAYTAEKATIEFPGLANGLLSDGNYTATLTGVADDAGNALSTDVFDFFFLTGDADHNKTVDTIDFGILASTFGQTGFDFSGGDFDYSGTVDTVDFGLLVANFSTSLPGDGLRPPASTGVAASPPAGRAGAAMVPAPAAKLLGASIFSDKTDISLVAALLGDQAV